MPKSQYVRQMFAGIVPHYDCANRILSGGQDALWRRRLIREVCAYRPEVVVDLATGSGEVAFALSKALGSEAKITGLDFCQPMLDKAMEKQSEMEGSDRVHFCLGDCQSLPFEDGTIDALCIAFGVRNLEDRQRGFQEMYRVLRSGGSLFTLEFSQPYPFFRPFYYFYLKTLLPLLARWITGQPEAYHYLVGSIEGFPTRAEITTEMQAVGFRKIRSIPLTFGVVAIHHAIA